MVSFFWHCFLPEKKSMIMGKCTCCVKPDFHSSILLITDEIFAHENCALFVASQNPSTNTLLWAGNIQS